MNMKEPLIKANRVFKYSITFQETNDESREVSDFSDSGFIIENETDEIGDILKLAQQTYGIYYPISFGGWESTTPEHNAKYFEKGIETYYALFIKNEDGTDITEEEYDFITFLLSDGNYNKSEFTDYAVGGVVLGALALGVGGLIAYYYFNKRKKGYPTGSAWTKEHYHDNEDEDYEVEPSKRKVPARNRKFVNGGGVEDEVRGFKVGDYFYETPSEIGKNRFYKITSIDKFYIKADDYTYEVNKDTHLIADKIRKGYGGVSSWTRGDFEYKVDTKQLSRYNKGDLYGYSKGGEIEVVGKGNKGAFRKREYEGMTEKEVIQWWEQRGYKLSKTKSESSLKPYTFYINKFVNGGGVGDKIDLLKDELEKLGIYVEKSLDIEKIPYLRIFPTNDPDVIENFFFINKQGKYEMGNHYYFGESEKAYVFDNRKQIVDFVKSEKFETIKERELKEQKRQSEKEEWLSPLQRLKKNRYVDGGGVDNTFVNVLLDYGFFEKRSAYGVRHFYNKSKDFYASLDNNLRKLYVYKDDNLYVQGREYSGYSIQGLIYFLNSNGFKRGNKFDNGGTTTTRPTTTPEVVPDTTPTTPKTPFKPKHIPKPKARKYDFILIKK